MTTTPRTAVRVVWGDVVMDAGHTQVPNLFLRNARRLNLTATEQMLIVHLMQGANMNGGADVTTYRELGQRLLLSRERTRRIVCWLAGRPIPLGEGKHRQRDEAVLSLSESRTDEGDSGPNIVSLAPLTECLRALSNDVRPRGGVVVDNPTPQEGVWLPTTPRVVVDNHPSTKTVKTEKAGSPAEDTTIGAGPSPTPQDSAVPSPPAIPQAELVELVAAYRTIPGVEAKRYDYSAIRKHVNKHGADRVRGVLNDPDTRGRIGRAGDSLGYLAGVLAHPDRPTQAPAFAGGMMLPISPGYDPRFANAAHVATWGAGHD